MNVFGKIALTGLALSLSTFASAAVTGTTDFRVVLPEVLVLYHWDDVVLNLSDAGRVVNDNATRTGTAALGSTAVSIGPAVATTADALTTSVAVTLKDAWAVRNLSTNKGVTLTLDNTNSKLLSVADQNSFLTTKDAALASTNTKVTGTGKTLNIASGWAPVLGDINFNLDLTTADSSGEYNTRGVAGIAGNLPADNLKDTFKLTLTGK